MAGILPAEGETLVANLIILGTDVNRGTGLEMGLFTNSTGVDNTITHTALTEPSTGGYARKTLVNGTWTGAAGARAYAPQIFTAAAGGIPNIRGWFICTTGGTAKKIIAIEIDANGPVSLAAADAYSVTPTITLS